MNIAIVGTDTEVGKTVINAIIGLQAQCKGINYLPYKPIETGCCDGDIGEDLKFLINMYGRNAMQGNSIDRNSLQLYSYSYPCAPGLAAKFDKAIQPDLQAVIKQARQLQSVAPVIFEGCGGLMVPINDKNETVLDIVKSLNYEVVVVGRSSLGTINHTAMTIKILQEHNLRIKGFILNDGGGDNIDNKIIEDNISSIKLMCGVQFLGQVGQISSLLNNQDDTTLRQDLLSVNMLNVI